MLVVHQPRFFSRNFVLFDGESPVAEIRYRSFGVAAEIQIGAGCYTAMRTGWFRCAYRLDLADSVVATAEPIGFWQRDLEVRTGPSAFTLRRRGWSGQAWELFDGDSPIGSVTRRGVFRTQTTVDLPDSIAPPVQAFIAWLANVIWQYDQSAAAVVVTS